MDCRAFIKIDFEAYGKKIVKELNINYWPNSNGVDDRIIETFKEIWEECRAAAENTSTNTRFTQCPSCGSTRICHWTCHDRYGCYDCDWVEAQRKA